MQGIGSRFQNHILTLVSMFLKWTWTSLKENSPIIPLNGPFPLIFGPFQAISGQFRSFSLSIWRNVHERPSKCQSYKNLTKRFSECPSDLILWQCIWCILNIKTKFVTLPSVTTYRSTLPPTQILYKCRVFWFKITVMISTARLLHKVSRLFIELASLN